MERSFGQLLLDRSFANCGCPGSISAMNECNALPLARVRVHLGSAARESQIWHRGAACGVAAGARSTTEVLAQAGNGEVNLPVSG
jgi:hypothetical protein